MPAPRGINAAADIQSTTADGRLLNAIWQEWIDVLNQYNAGRAPLVAALSFQVTDLLETVTTGQTVRPELATEYGVAQSRKNTITSEVYGYDFRWYDFRRGYTHRYLQTVTTEQLNEQLAETLEGFDALSYEQIMKQLFTNANRTAYTEDANGVATLTQIPVYSLWNGADGKTPPPYGANTFSSNHSHLKTSGAAAIDSQDVEDLLTDVQEHGFSIANGSTLVVVVNPAQAKAIRSWRANVANANGAVAAADFIPALGQPGLLVGTNVLGATQPASTFLGLNVIGSYNGALIVEEPRIPAGYVVCFASGGAFVKGNVVGVRESSVPALRGVLQTPGDNGAVPLVNAHWEKGFGTGIRQRGAASIPADLVERFVHTADRFRWRVLLVSRQIDLDKVLTDEEVAYLTERDDARLTEAKLPKPKADKPKA